MWLNGFPCYAQANFMWFDNRIKNLKLTNFSKLQKSSIFKISNFKIAKARFANFTRKKSYRKVPHLNQILHAAYWSLLLYAYKKFRSLADLCSGIWDFTKFIEKSSTSKVNFAKSIETLHTRSKNLVFRKLESIIPFLQNSEKSLYRWRDIELLIYTYLIMLQDFCVSRLKKLHLIMERQKNSNID